MWIRTSNYLLDEDSQNQLNDKDKEAWRKKDFCLAIVQLAIVLQELHYDVSHRLDASPFSEYIQ